MTTLLDLHADHLADVVETGAVPAAGLTRHELTLATIALVRRHGAADAHRLLDAAYATRADRHETLLGFLVWAADRLLTAGLTTRAVVWHPLLTPGAEFAWWDRDTFFAAPARHDFVRPTLARPGDPVPTLPAPGSGDAGYPLAS